MTPRESEPDRFDGHEVDARPSSVPGFAARHYLAAIVAVGVGAVLWWWVLSPRIA